MTLPSRRLDQTPEEYFYGRRALYPELCPNCGTAYYNGDLDLRECAQCGRFPICSNCALNCEDCGCDLCQACAEQVDGLCLCADCKAEHLRVLAVERIRDAESFSEKAAAVLAWAMDRVMKAS